MKITFEFSGGFAYIPAFNKPFTIDTTEADSETATQLERLIMECHFFNRPSVIKSGSQGAADHRTYTINVEDGQRRHKIQVTDPVQDQQLHQLISILANMARSSGNN